MGFPDHDPALDGNLGMVFALFQGPAINITVAVDSCTAATTQVGKHANQSAPDDQATRIAKRARSFFSQRQLVS